MGTFYCQLGTVQETLLGHSLTQSISWVFGSKTLYELT